MCWGSKPYAVLDSPAGLFKAVAAAKEHALAIGLGRYLAVATGHYHSVGTVDTPEPCAEDLNGDQSVVFSI